MMFFFTIILAILLLSVGIGVQKRLITRYKEMAQYYQHRCEKAEKENLRLAHDLTNALKTDKH